jgi:hypothetical protein
MAGRERLEFEAAGAVASHHRCHYEARVLARRQQRRLPVCP